MSSKKMKPLTHLEPFLKTRIKDLIFVKNKYPDELILASELQTNYPVYKRMKLNVLKIQIRQCLDEIGDEDSELECNANDDIEMRTDENAKFVIDKKPSNMFNNSINELYKRSLNQSTNLDNQTLDTTNEINQSLIDASFNQSASNQLDKSMDKSKLIKSKKSIKKRSLDEESEHKIDKLLNKQLKIKNKYVKEAKLNFNDFAGIDEKIIELKRFVNHFKVKESFYPKDYKCLLIHGPSGVGKSSLVDAIANYLSACFLSTILSSSNNNDQVFSDLLELIKLNESGACIILLDRIDSIGLKIEGSNLEKDRNIIVQLECFLDNLPDFNEKKVLVIATTNKYEKLDAEIQNLFDVNLKLDLPNQQARHSILNLICEKHLPNAQLQLNVDQLSKQTPGFVAKDYHNLFITAKHIANERHLTQQEHTYNLNDQEMLIANNKSSSTVVGITNQDVEKALKLISPASKNEGFANMSNVSWEDIGALEEAKDLLKLCILDRVKYKEIADAFKLNKPVGILMYGPPGCGKTLLAKAIANEAEINFISVGGPEILNKYVGESERAVRELFQRANKLKPCLIFFDEFDSISSCKTDSSNDVTTRVMKQLLVEMDGYDSRSCFMLAATNRPDLIDPAILRPGRFNKAIYIGVPNAEERVDILKTITKNGTFPKCSTTVDFSKIGSNATLDGYSGADLTELIDTATECAFKRFINRKELGEQLDQNKAVVNEEDFEYALKKIRPPLSEKQRRRYEEMKIKFENMQK